MKRLRSDLFNIFNCFQSFSLKYEFCYRKGIIYHWNYKEFHRNYNGWVTKFGPCRWNKRHSQFYEWIIGVVVFKLAKHCFPICFYFRQKSNEENEWLYIYTGTYLKTKYIVILLLMNPEPKEKKGILSVEIIQTNTTCLNYINIY